MLVGCQTLPPTKNGQALYEKHCIQCHGATGKGDGELAKNLPFKSQDLEEELAHHDDDELIEEIKEGKPEKGMPAWENVLHDHEIKSILTYLRHTL